MYMHQYNSSSSIYFFLPKSAGFSPHAWVSHFNILEEYVKPAVAADGGNILFDSYDQNTKQVKVVLQGSCNGCPSSTFTLKNGIESMLKNMLNDNEIVVEALNS